MQRVWIYDGCPKGPSAVFLLTTYLRQHASEKTLSCLLIFDGCGRRNRRRRKNGSNLGVVSFFGLLVKDRALFGIAASRTDIGLTLEPEDRLGQILEGAYQNHLFTARHTAHYGLSATWGPSRLFNRIMGSPRSLYNRYVVGPGLGSPLLRFGVRIRRVANSPPPKGLCPVPIGPGLCPGAVMTLRALDEVRKLVWHVRADQQKEPSLDATSHRSLTARRKGPALPPQPPDAATRPRPSCRH